MNNELRSRLKALTAPVLEKQGYTLVSLDYADRILSVTITKEGGVSAEDCAAASRAISSVLDEKDPIKERYSLVVSSPGVHNHE